MEALKRELLLKNEMPFARAIERLVLAQSKHLLGVIKLNGLLCVANAGPATAAIDTPEAT